MAERPNFTPGPWKVSASGFGKIEITATVEEEHCDVAEIDARYLSGRYLQAAHADARLIAAAPALYEALLRLRNEADLDGMREKAGWDCWLALADQALAAAREGGANG